MTHAFTSRRTLEHWSLAVAIAAIAMLTAGPATGQSDAGDSPEQGFAVANVMRDAMPAVVRVDLEIGGSKTVSISGFLVSDRGHVLTVGVADITDAGVRFQDGSTYAANLVGLDRVMNLALLEIEGDVRREPIPFGSATELGAGRLGLVLQSPHRPGATIGRIDGVETPKDGAIYLTSDVHVPKTSLGGPLLDADGRAVGVLMPGGDNDGLRAVPTDLLEGIVERFERHEPAYYASIGIDVKSLDGRLARSLGVSPDAGVLVSTVFAGGPSAGKLQAGDLITAIAGQPVDQAIEVPVRIAGRSPGSDVEISYRRNDKSHTTTLTLARRGNGNSTVSRGESDDGSSNAERARLGAAVKPVTEALVERHNLGPKAGLLVTGIQDDSPADGKLQAGDVIMSVNDTDVSTIDEIKRALATQPPGQSTRLRVSRERNEMLIIVDLYN